MKSKSLTLLLFLLMCVTSLQAQTRYVDSLFTCVQTHTDWVYATAPELNTPYAGENSTHVEELKMHVFQPQEDTLSLRPMLVCIHGGGFILGTKEHDDMMAFCREFAERGYVTATIQYRLGMNFWSQISAERSVYRAIQDSRAVMRFIKENAVELKVDTTHVFMLGSSAGALVALHNLFMDNEEERPASSYEISNNPSAPNNGPDLGDFDAIGPQNQCGAHPKAIISLWGAVQDTLLIEPADVRYALLLVHGTDDAVVPFGVGHPFGLPSLPQTFGSYPIHERLTHLGIAHETYFVEGVGHEFYGVVNGNWPTTPNAYWDSVLTKTTDFLDNQLKPMVDFTYTTNNNEVIFTNDSEGGQYLWDFGDGQTSQEQNPVHDYEQSGSYQVTLTVYNQIQSQNILSRTIDISMTDVVETVNVTLPKKFTLYQNYPNPFNPATTIRYDVPEELNVDIRIYDLRGHHVVTLWQGYKQAGRHLLQWNGRDTNGVSVSSGVYVMRLKAGDFMAQRKITLIK